MGKTSLGLRLINGGNQTRVFIFDHQGLEFASRLEIPPERVATDTASLIRLAEENRIVPFDFVPNYGGYKEQGFREFCETVFALAVALEAMGKSAVMVTDEIQQFVSTSECPIEYKQIIETGRRWNLDTVQLSQRPNAVNAAMREQFTELFLFRLQEENSLKFAASIGANVETVMNLPPHEYLYFHAIKGREATGKLEFGGQRAVK